MTVGISLITNLVLEASYPKAESYSLFSEVKLDDDIKQQVLLWVDALNIKVFKRNYAIDQLCIIVHCVYIALCETLEPVKADEIMNKAINRTSKLSAAKSYSPRNFL